MQWKSGNRLVVLCACLAGVVVLPACSVTYPLQAARGQLSLVNNREPVAELLAAAELVPAIRPRLEASRAILDFAHVVLLLPDNGSYRFYTDTGKPYVVWNVFAAPEFSLNPQRWCFPVAGCVAYRGYFAEAEARKFAARMSAAGYDVYVGGVRAYSTLGKFKDPLLNTMMSMSDAEFAGLIFHELAHQKLYVKDDSAFNESFATAVEEAGLSRWYADHAQELPDRSAYERRRREVIDMLKAARGELRRLYSKELPPDIKRANKQQILDDLPNRYAKLERRWRAELKPGAKYRRPYARCVAQGLNNASLSAVATYTDYVAAFERLLQAACADDLECFYTAARELGEMPADKRKARLEQLHADARRAQPYAYP
jgi:predicted aminopeptidase